MAVGYRSSSSTGTADTNGTSCVVPVPAGAAAGDIALLAVEMWETFDPTGVTPPAGFTQIVDLLIGNRAKLKVWWKRLTGADTGNYTVTWSSAQWNLGHCMLVTGALASGDPVEATNTATAASGTSIPSTTVTTATLAFLAHFVSNENSALATPATGFTEVQDSNYLHTNYRIPGATGTQTASGGTLASSTASNVALIAIKPDTGGAAPAVPVYPISQYGNFH